MKADVPSECTFISGRGHSRIDRRDTRPRKRPRATSIHDQLVGSDLRAASTLSSFTHGHVAGGLTDPGLPFDLSAVPARPLKPGGVHESSLSHAFSKDGSLAAPSNSRHQLNQSLPPLVELEAMVHTFFATVFQVGFLHETSFRSRLRQDPTQISRFLLLSILATSAADTPLILSKTGGRTGAVAEGQAYFESALSMAFNEIAEPTLERIQAFYLLAQQDWMEGRGQRSWVLMGIGIRLASLLGLEKKESYYATPESSPEVLIVEEEARRT